MKNQTQLSRRSFASLSLAVAAGALAKPMPATAQAAQPDGRTYLLVHGSWHGGWCWVRVAEQLRAAGHQVFTPTLTGLGERSHLLKPQTNIATHVEDIVNVMKWEQLENCVLVAHSYAGMLVPGICEAAGERIASLVMLDAFMPEEGEMLVDLVSKPVAAAFETLRSDGAAEIPPLPAAFFNVNEADRAWVDAMCTPQPLVTSFDATESIAARKAIAAKSYYRADRFPSPHFDVAFEAAEAAEDWSVRRFECGHDVMVDEPTALTEALLTA